MILEQVGSEGLKRGDRIRIDVATGDYTGPYRVEKLGQDGYGRLTSLMVRAVGAKRRTIVTREGEVAEFDAPGNLISWAPDLAGVRILIERD